jgi:hypothetical protein
VSAPNEAGEALNVLVAERVFEHVEANAPVGDGMSRTGIFSGATLAECDADIRERYKKHALRGELWPAEYVGPDYSGEIAAAFLVVEKMRASGWAFVDIACDLEGRWSVVFWRRYHRAGGVGRAAATLPHAICLAALAALEATPSSQETRKENRE